jgi:hypothetical protein
LLDVFSATVTVCFCGHAKFLFMHLGEWHKTRRLGWTLPGYFAQATLSVVAVR